MVVERVGEEELSLFVECGDQWVPSKANIAEFPSRASRSTVCATFARVLGGEDPADFARDRPGPALPFYPELAGPTARARRERALEDLAHTVAQGGRIRLMCVCSMLPQAMLRHVVSHTRARARAHELAAPRDG
eukprot:scaffold12184_cov114-Isochrysis_galbana.AAC.1